jgi:hypothetical protein
MLQGEENLHGCGVCFPNAKVQQNFTDMIEKTNPLSLNSGSCEAAAGGLKSSCVIFFKSQGTLDVPNQELTQVLS